MYLSSEALLTRIREIADEAAARSNGRVRYEERIALPYFGTIILRFSLDPAPVSLEELDRLEALLDDLVGEEFLSDFMGSVYRSICVSYENMERVYAALAAKYRDEPWKPTIHAEAIRTDAKELLASVGLDPELPVWEIQPEDEEILLLVLGEEERILARTEGEQRITAAEVRSELCTGLFQAACFAKRNRVSLARLLLEA